MSYLDHLVWFADHAEMVTFFADFQQDTSMANLVNWLAVWDLPE